MSAIIQVSEWLREIRILNCKLKSDGADYFLLPAIFAEDISSAFESICHKTIGRILDRIFDNNAQEVKLRSLIMSYLERESYVIDRESGVKEKVTKVHIDRTSPQGSILSPTLWRAYDATFFFYLQKIAGRFQSFP